MKRLLPLLLLLHTVKALLFCFSLLVATICLGQSGTTFNPTSKEVRGHIDDVWKREYFKNCSISLEADDSYNTVTIIIYEDNKKVVFDLNNTRTGLKWTTDEGYEFKIIFLKGSDSSGKSWLVEFYVPMKNYDKPILVLKNERIVIRYK